MKKMLTSAWMTVLISALIYMGATALFWKTPVITPAAAETDSLTGPRANVTGVSWEFVNPEADQLVTELKTEKKMLSKKEQDLSDLAARLQAERTELNLVTKSVQKMQTDFDQSVLHVKDDEIVNLKKLAKVYSNMAGESAAAIFSEMDDSSVVKILLFMKDGETSAVLEAMAKKSQPDAKRAADFSERLRLAQSRKSAASATAAPTK